MESQEEEDVEELVLRLEPVLPLPLDAECDKLRFSSSLSPSKVIEAREPNVVFEDIKFEAIKDVFPEPFMLLYLSRISSFT